jgi:hypothetical protein
MDHHIHLLPQMKARSSSVGLGSKGGLVHVQPGSIPGFCRVIDISAVASEADSL